MNSNVKLLLLSIDVYTWSTDCVCKLSKLYQSWIQLSSEVLYNLTLTTLCLIRHSSRSCDDHCASGLTAIQYITVSSSNSFLASYITWSTRLVKEDLSLTSVVSYRTQRRLSESFWMLYRYWSSQIASSSWRFSSKSALRVTLWFSFSVYRMCSSSLTWIETCSSSTIWVLNIKYSLSICKRSVWLL